MTTFDSADDEGENAESLFAESDSTSQNPDFHLSYAVSGE
jgi:hypothetical protein